MPTTFLLKPFSIKKIRNVQSQTPQITSKNNHLYKQTSASTICSGVYIAFLFLTFPFKALILATCKLCAGPRSCMQPLTNSSMSTEPLASTSMRFSLLKSHVQFGMHERLPFLFFCGLFFGPKLMSLGKGKGPHFTIL